MWPPPRSSLRGCAEAAYGCGVFGADGHWSAAESEACGAMRRRVDEATTSEDPLGELQVVDFARAPAIFDGAGGRAAWERLDRGLREGGWGNEGVC